MRQTHYAKILKVIFDTNTDYGEFALRRNEVNGIMKDAGGTIGETI